jgi:DNA-binding CsgD family transcriptional regulator
VHRYPPDALAVLTLREREVLALIAQGRSDTAIADTFTISPRVVEKHVASIFAELGMPPSHNDNRRCWRRSSAWSPDPPGGAALSRASRCRCPLALQLLGRHDVRVARVQGEQGARLCALACAGRPLSPADL